MPCLVRVPVGQRIALNELVNELKYPPKSMTYRPGDYSRALRAYMRLSQRELGRRTGLGQAQISRIERGRVDAGLGTWRRLFDGLVCDVILVPRPRRRPGDVLGERLVGGDPFRDLASPWKEKNAKIPAWRLRRSRSTRSTS